ncbi:restriction endonuclease subunit S [Alkalihalophilus marmarensis]|uniref:restriction endonuclease subunit S n=1 Tax=Alkalihalophilus marmarensis TaxID=521377 RepID=UPI002E1C10FC|nr:restriction endonuclease subunit S [Alkalihalophilus marmarensis]
MKLEIESLPKGWEVLKVEDIQAEEKGATVTGPFGSSIGRKYFVDEGVPVIRGNNLTKGQKKYVDDGYVFVSEEKFQELYRCHAIPDDIIFTAAGTIGQVGILPKDSKYQKYLISNKQMRLRVDIEKVLPLYVYYWFSSPAMIKMIERSNTGSTVPLINLTILRDLPIVVPPIEVQQKIVSILENLTNKTSLNNKINQTLEKMAMALYNHWFVDFGPFQDLEFVETELGMIPEGWEVVTLKDVVAVNKNNIKNDYPYKNILYIDISSVFEGKLEGYTEYSLSDAPSRAKRLVNDGDIIWSTVRPNRKSYLYMHKPYSNTIVSTGFAVLSPIKIPSSFLYLHVITNKFVSYLVNNAKGSAYPAVNASTFKEAKLCLPSKEVINNFNNLVSPLINLKNENETENVKLTLTRDYLLPKLLSGEVDLSGVEETVEKIMQ